MRFSPQKTKLERSGEDFVGSFARAVLIDPAFKVRLAEVRRRLEARRSIGLPVRLRGLT